MANRAAKLAEQARKLQNTTEREQHTVINDPTIKRACHLMYKRNAASKPQCRDVGPWGISRKIKDWAEESAVRVIRVERVWWVYWMATGWERRARQFPNLILARAYREGLRFHFAQFLMTKGTAAEKLV